LRRYIPPLLRENVVFRHFWLAQKMRELPETEEP
jgi:hypothetical protein